MSILKVLKFKILSITTGTHNSSSSKMHIWYIFLFISSIIWCIKDLWIKINGRETGKNSTCTLFFNEIKVLFYKLLYYGCRIFSRQIVKTWIIIEEIVPAPPTAIIRIFLFKAIGVLCLLVLYVEYIKKRSEE